MIGKKGRFLTESLCYGSEVFSNFKFEQEFVLKERFPPDLCNGLIYFLELFKNEKTGSEVFVLCDSNSIMIIDPISNEVVYRYLVAGAFQYPVFEKFEDILLVGHSKEEGKIVCTYSIFPPYKKVKVCNLTEEIRSSFGVKEVGIFAHILCLKNLEDPLFLFTFQCPSAYLFDLNCNINALPIENEKGTTMHVEKTNPIQCKTNQFLAFLGVSEGYSYSTTTIILLNYNACAIAELGDVEVKEKDFIVQRFMNKGIGATARAMDSYVDSNGKEVLTVSYGDVVSVFDVPSESAEKSIQIPRHIVGTIAGILFRYSMKYFGSVFAVKGFMFSGITQGAMLIHHIGGGKVSQVLTNRSNHHNEGTYTRFLDISKNGRIESIRFVSVHAPGRSNFCVYKLSYTSTLSSTGEDIQERNQNLVKIMLDASGDVGSMVLFDTKMFVCISMGSKGVFCRFFRFLLK